MVNKLETMFQPFLDEAQVVADQFDEQLQEKQKIVNDINEKLNTRIISLNLLLNRADKFMSKQGMLNSYEESAHQKPVFDIQQEVIELFENGLTPDKIAKKIGIPKGEVNLVLDLKKRFIDIENFESPKKDEINKSFVYNKTNEYKTGDNFKNKSSLTNNNYNISGHYIKNDFNESLMEIESLIEEDKVDLSSSNNKIAYNNNYKGVATAETLNADEILALSNKGMDPLTIARKMGVAKGEIDLILNLKQKFMKIEKESM